MRAIKESLNGYNFWLLVTPSQNYSIESKACTTHLSGVQVVSLVQNICISEQWNTSPMKASLVFLSSHVKFLHPQLQRQCYIAQAFNTGEFVVGNNVFFFITKPFYCQKLNFLFR